MTKYKIIIEVDIQDFNVELVREDLVKDLFYRYTFLSDLRWAYLEPADGEIIGIQIEEVE
jgi:hypothetical protein